jgi:hypothetical protein
VTDEWPPRVIDPAGREVVFDGSTQFHLLDRSRDGLLDAIDVVLEAVANPSFREGDPLPDRERFFRQDFPSVGSWLRVVVDFSETPARVVTAFVDIDPRLRHQ